MGTVRVTGSSSNRGGEHSLTITGSEEDIEKLRSAIRGTSWFGIENGNAVTHSRFSPLPDPIEDPEMHPFWSLPTAEEKANLERFTFEELDPRGIYSASIIIQSLCGYNYSKENYRRQAHLLESYGMIQMRSPRGIDGGYWELWYLPGAYSARGLLRQTLDDAKAEDEKERKGSERDMVKENRRELEVMINFFRNFRNAEFGTLDVCIQRLAMVIDD